MIDLFYYVLGFWSNVEGPVIIYRWTYALFCYRFLVRHVLILVKQLRTGDSFLATQKNFDHFLFQIIVIFAFVLNTCGFEIFGTVVHYDVQREKIIKLRLWTLTTSTWNNEMIKLIIFVYHCINFVINYLHIPIIFILFVDRSLELIVNGKIWYIVTRGICVNQCRYTFSCKV